MKKKKIVTVDIQVVHSVFQFEAERSVPESQIYVIPKANQRSYISSYHAEEPASSTSSSFGISQVYHDKTWPGGATIRYLHIFISNPPAKFLLLV